MTATTIASRHASRRGTARTYVVLTATVRPNAAGPLVVSDPSSRLANYVDAAAHWRDVADRSNASLVVLENSGAASEFRRATNLDVVDCPPSSTQTAARGKGACEADMLRHGLCAIADREHGEPVWIVKATGRLWVTRADLLIRLSSRGADLVAEIDHARRWFDSRFFAGDSRVISDLCTAAVDLCDDGSGSYLEHVLYDLTLGRQVDRFPSRPFLNGISGSTGVPYGKGALRRVLRIAGPHLSLVHRRLTSGAP
ncbi:MAG: hypothetical protein ABI658_32380 [Acidimicrobiales bacterium]